VPLAQHDAVGVARRELSGLALRPDGLLVAVSDAAPVAVVLDTAGTTVSEFDFSEGLLREMLVCPSEAARSACGQLAALLSTQWEAIAVDGKGNHWLLNEALSVVVGFDSAFRRVISAIRFDLSGLPGARRARQGETVGGEGLVILANGHILLAKEQNPNVIVELGPPAEIAQGFSRGLVLEHGQAFVAPARAHFEVLHSWRIELPTADCDLSDLTTDAEGRLFLLSQKCRLIAQLQDLSPDAAAVAPELVRAVPHSLRHPEGLVLTPAGPVVADDHKTAAPGIVMLAQFRD
jgi:hypothetical protein